MDFSSSDSEGENMDNHLERHRTPSPSTSPPEIRVLEDDYNQIDTSCNCGSFITELDQLMLNIDNFNFESEEQKNEYYEKLKKIFSDAANLMKNLRNTESDHYEVIVSTQRRVGLVTKDSPFKQVKSKKNVRKPPTQPPELASKKQRTEVETTNKFDGRQY
ncbi:hypothetical protein TNIN_369831 [Trichonephila inaurata madagascariensis]|uniref:Uncharacterized protein n=1 Tax=Trichonephila inaurata madagascariensis TaxID=2747483 RepID=A0A8X6MLB7_9ARAC|nr:hypothetical protein TNIN_369831 [Trichonephila inaurata madagascariensis]